MMHRQPAILPIHASPESALTSLQQLRPLCLASASPRRRELLAQFGLSFTVQSAAVDETPRGGEAAADYVRRLAGEKACAVQADHPGHGILGGDTTVVVDGDMLGKPADRAEAQAMLRRLSGRTHQVLSGYHLREADGGWHEAGVVETRVTFRPLDGAWIDWYTAQPECLDKAGAYGVQGLGSVMVARIEGSYANVVGLPIETVFWAVLARGWVAL
jgi:septum formation protein